MACYMIEMINKLIVYRKIVTIKTKGLILMGTLE